MHQKPDSPILPDHADGQAGPPEPGALPDTFQDSRFTVKRSEDMVLRNLLRTGLVEAQGKDTGLIPLFVSWPHWLEDGIVCLYAKDFQRILDDIMSDMAQVVKAELPIGGIGEPPTTPEP